jgi:phage gp45-like
MHRTPPRPALDRIANSLSRSVVGTINDSPFMQTLGIKIRGAETNSDVEHWHPFGSTAFPMGATTDEQAKEGMIKGAAEVILGTLTGNNSHPIAMPAADRRFRPNGMKAGEHVLHDAFKQFLHFGKEAAVLESPKSFVHRVASDKKQSGDSGSSEGSGSSGGQQRKNNGANVAAEKDVQVSVEAKQDGTYAVSAKDAGTLTFKTLTIKAGGCTITMADGKIILDGEVHLGGSGGKRVGMIGTLDTDSDALTEGGAATKVYAT